MRLTALLLLMLLPVFAQESTTRVIMGTFVTLTLPEQNSDLREPAFQVLEGVDRRFSTYKPDSEISRLNQGATLTPSFPMRELLGYAKAVYALTDGLFDPSVGRFTKKAYAFGTDHERIPEASELKTLTQASGFTTLDEEAPILALPSGMQLDFGGIAKGYAVQKTSALLIRSGVTSGQIAASGDILCLNVCDVAITDPWDESSAFARFTTLAPFTSVSTSGTYRRYIKNSTHHHLLDPKTGQPKTGAVSVTLIARNANTLIDALATAVGMMTKEEAPEFLRRFPDIAWVLIYPDRSHLFSPNFSRLATGLVIQP